MVSSRDRTAQWGLVAQALSLALSRLSACRVQTHLDLSVRRPVGQTIVFRRLSSVRVMFFGRKATQNDGPNGRFLESVEAQQAPARACIEFWSNSSGTMP